ncbi:hypothetical protein SBDP1_1330022 [Syntrophobacter sp. SbD1]|nr:hypothetical protein SBDP1_1330022 [Syntrophobacter sp. SbD1]
MKPKVTGGTEHDEYAAAKARGTMHQAYCRAYFYAPREPVLAGRGRIGR